jgi:hypothetical protein
VNSLAVDEWADLPLRPVYYEFGSEEWQVTGRYSLTPAQAVADPEFLQTLMV